MGQTGLRRFSGFLFEEFLQELLQWRGAAIYKEMAWNDPVVTSMLFAITMLIRRVSWRVEEASEDNEDQLAGEFLTSCQQDMSQSWVDIIAEVVNSMLTYGYSYHELVYKRRLGDSQDPSKRSQYVDGRVGWRKIPIRSADTIYRWLFDDHGGVQGAQQLAPPHYNQVIIPIEKALHFRPTIDKNNPEGKSLLRGAYRPWYMKKNIENIEAIGIERDLAGLPIAYVPPEILTSGASADQKALLGMIKDIVVNVRRDAQEGIVFPLVYDASGKPLFDFKLLSTGGSRQFDTDKVIQRYDQRIAMTMLADFVLLGHEKVGSFALASSKTNIFATAMGGILDMVAEIFNRYAIPRLFAFNDFKISKMPKIVHGDIESVDLKELGEYVRNLASSGYPLFPNIDLEKYLMKVASMPEPEGPKKERAPTLDLAAYRRRRITEILDTPVQEPSGLSYLNDTTPVNPTPIERDTFSDDVAAGERARGRRR